VNREGLKLVLLTRLCPAFPSSLLNLVHGPSEVSLRDDVNGLIAILPGTMLFCSLGALAAGGARFGEVPRGTPTWAPGARPSSAWWPRWHRPGWSVGPPSGLSRGLVPMNLGA